jgi:hypothetical protein
LTPAISTTTARGPAITLSHRQHGSGRQRPSGTAEQSAAPLCEVARHVAATHVTAGSGSAFAAETTTTKTGSPRPTRSNWLRRRQHRRHLLLLSEKRLSHGRLHGGARVIVAEQVAGVEPWHHSGHPAGHRRPRPESKQARRARHR